MKLIERIKNWYLEKHKIAIHLDLCSIKYGKKMVKHEVAHDDITCYYNGSKKFSSIHERIYLILKKYFDTEISDDNPCKYIKVCMSTVSTDSPLYEYLFFTRVAKDTYRFEKDRSLYMIDNIPSIITVELCHFINKNKHNDVRLYVKLDPDCLDGIFGMDAHSVADTSKLYHCDQ